MPINPQACPGPCNGRARQAWEQYDEAAIRHIHAMGRYLDAYHRWQTAMEAWQAAIPLWHPPYVLAPIEPARPEPPRQPGIPVNIAAPNWCARCPRTLRSALAELDDTAALLDASISGHRGAAMAGPNGTKPIDHTAIVESLDELIGFLFETEDLWRAARGYPPRPRRARGAHARAVSVGWLLGQLDDMLWDPWSVEVGLEVLRWQRRLRGMTKSDPTSRRSPIACPRCRERQVARRDDGYWECGSCGRLLSEAEYGREYQEQADEHDHKQPATAV